MAVLFLTVEDLLRLHARSIRAFGGEAGVLDRGRLESAAAKPRNRFGDVEAHPTIFDKAAAYLYFLVKAHAFVDGNKRIAVLAAITLLDLNGYDLDADTDEFETLVLEVIMNTARIEDIARFFCARARRRRR